MNSHPTHNRLRPNRRRGMLLLMVLTILSLFLVVGTLGIAIALRSRESARAFAAATAGPSQLPVIARAAADEALLILVRGSTDPKVKQEVTESLLGDMFGMGTNGKFIDEPWDAFDNANRFLTRLTLNANGQVTGAPRPAFQKDGENPPAAEVDNDGDGVFDGVWLENVLPSMKLPDGGELTFKVSYLVLDLDGRINVNAHGRRADDTRVTGEPEGPADIQAPTVVGGTTSWQLLLTAAGGQLPVSGTSAPSVQWRLPPTLPSQTVDGRFASAPSRKTYDLRLDLEGPRPAMLTSATSQNPFTLGELERVLRQFDPDAATLPPRLAAILGDNTERCRMRVTTDSWDTPGQKKNIKWAAPNAGVNDEVAFWKMLVPVIVSAGASQNEAEQWVANLVEFRDKDTSPTTPYPNGINGVEPTRVGIPGPWDLGYFLSPAQVLGVPMGTEQEIKDLLADNKPVKSLVLKYPKILELITVPSLFAATIAIDPTREPGRVNVNTCDQAVWKALIDQDADNPYGDTTPAKDTLTLLKNIPLVFSDNTYDVSKINHSVANRLANAASIRSHVFAVWVSVEVTNSSPTGATPSCHRLFAIVDRSIPVSYSEGQNSVPGQNGSVRDIIRLQRFLN